MDVFLKYILAMSSPKHYNPSWYKNICLAQRTDDGQTEELQCIDKCNVTNSNQC